MVGLLGVLFFFLDFESEGGMGLSSSVVDVGGGVDGVGTFA